MLAAAARHPRSRFAFFGRKPASFDSHSRQGLSSDEALRLERRLRAFARLAADASDADDKDGAADETGGVEERLVVLEQEVVALRRTAVSAMNEFKEMLAEVRGTMRGAAGTKSSAWHGGALG